MTPNFKDNYHNSIVQICTSGGAQQGCGVIVSEDLVVTCSHVVVRVLQHNAAAQSTGQPDPDSVWIRRPYVDGLRSEPKEVRILHCIPHNTTSEIADIAILQLKGERFSLHAGDAIASFTPGVVPLYTNVMALGFPMDAARTTDNSATAHYVIRDHTPFHWYHAVAEAAVGHEIRAGFSGSPVMDEGSGELIGIISEADAARRTATIIPTACLREVYPFPVSTCHTSVTPDTPDQTDVPVPDLYKPGIRLLLDLFAPRLHHFLTCRLGLLEKPRELETLHRYSAHNRAAWEEELSQKTYLPPPAKEIGHTASCYDDPNMKAIHVPIQQAIKEIAGISSGGDSSTAQISALSKQTRRVRNLVRRVQYSQKPLIVLGEPGSGKSLTLKQAAIAFSKLNQGRIFPTVCIFINLGKWKPVARPDVLHVEQLVRSNVPAAIVSWLPQLADQRRLIILFDGLDEMSRVQYTEHTKALSSYATANEGKIKTLFSCRIADFSPTFRHHRLVLLPFTKKHIQTYLERKFANIPLTLRSGTFTMRQLAQKLDDENLPIQAHNPFSLWLLCLYLGQKGKFPGSRVELLLYSFEYQFDRKKSEHEGLPFPDRKKSFDAWGLLAYTITRRNKGTDIERHELRGLFGPETDSIVSTGALTGVLHRTLENDLPLVRFTHHRAQEFFTAYHIAHAQPEIAWKDYLDIPRWQETIVNLSEMDGGKTPLKELTESLDKFDYIALKKNHERFRRRFVPGDETRAHPILRNANDVHKETILAERLEFASRLVTTRAASDEHDTLVEKLTFAVEQLTLYGDPTSKVKMLRVIQRLPAEKFTTCLRLLLNDDVTWVREQAQIVAAHRAGSAINSTLPLDTVVAYGNGDILSSFRQKISVAKKMKSPRAIIANATAVILFVLQLSILSSLAPLAAPRATDALTTYVTPIIARERVTFARIRPAQPAGAKQLKALYAEIDAARKVLRQWTPVALWMISGAMVLLVVFGVTPYWMITVRGFQAYTLLFLIFCLWLIAPMATIKSVLLALVAFIMAIVWLHEIIVLLAMACVIPVWAIFTGMMAAVTATWAKDSSYIKQTFNTCWSQSSIPRLRDLTGVNGLLTYSMLAVAAFAVVMALIIRFFLDQTFLPDLWNSLPSLNFHWPVITAAGVVWGIFIILIALVCHRVLVFFVVRLRFPKDEYQMIPARKKLTNAIVYLLSAVILLAVGKSFGKFRIFVENIPDLPIPNMMRWVIGILILAALFLLLRSLITASRKMLPRVRAALDLKERTMTPEEFKLLISISHPADQNRMLKLATPQFLNITVQSFLKLMIEIEPGIQREPARSTYFQKKAEIQELLRQDRG